MYNMSLQHSSLLIEYWGERHVGDMHKTFEKKDNAVAKTMKKQSIKPSKAEQPSSKPNS